MGLELNTIITLDNNEKYVLLSETMYNGKKYFLASLVDEENNVKTNDVAVLEEEVVGLDTYVYKVNDSDILIKLSKLLKQEI